MNKPEPKKEKVPPKKVYEIRIQFYLDGKAMIVRKDLPSLIDTDANSVSWLESHNYRPENIEIIGTKPDCWVDYYPAPVVEPTPSPVAEVAPMAEPVPETIAVTTVNLDTGTVVEERVKDVFEGIPVAPVTASVPESVAPIVAPADVPAVATEPVVPPEAPASQA